MKILTWIASVVVVAGAALFLLATMRPRDDSDSAVQYREAGRIPVVQGGRIKPLDTVARMSLLVISGRQEYTDADGRKQPAIRWLLDVMTSHLRDNDPSRSERVFRIENDQVLGLLHLQQRPGSFRYSIDEIMNGMPDEPAEAKAAEGKVANEKKANKAAAPKPPEVKEESNYSRLDARINKAQAKSAAERDIVDTKVLELASKLKIFSDLADLQAPHVVPPSQPNGDWQTLVMAAKEAKASGAKELSPDARRLVSLLQYYSEGKSDKFNSSVEQYLSSVKLSLPRATRVAGFETFFNSFAPFYQCILLYVVVFILAVTGWLVFGLHGSRPFWWSAFWLLVLVFCVHTFAIVSRIYIQGRPPVTNLYSSAIFIGWVVVALGIVVELLSRIGVATAVSAMIGFMTLIVAHNLGNDGDTMEVLQAVLDTNFWLATHVTSVTIGYAATFLAGTFGAAYILLGVLTPILKMRLGEVFDKNDPLRPKVEMDLAKLLSTMTYGVICFALFFSFVGTVLGGIWADQSWGRFWGWDPKENGAVLIVIWNALSLHARWGGMVRQRGLAMLAVFGNVVTLWSWFGVNMLGVGLHAYGFIPSAVRWLIVAGVVHFMIIALGALPERMWWSHLAQGQSPPRRTPRRDEAVEAAIV